jgi:hypothetical protein
VRTPGFEPACDQRIFAERFDALQVSHSEFPTVGNRATTPPAVAAIAHEPGPDGLRPRSPGHDCLVASIDGMQSELLAEYAFGQRRSGKDKQSAREFVEPLNFSQPRHFVRRKALFGRDRFKETVFQRRRQLAAARFPIPFRRVPNRADSRGLLDDDDVLVKMTDDKFRHQGSRYTIGFVKKFHDVARFKPAGGIEAEFRIDTNGSRTNESANLRPTRVAMVSAGKRRQRDAGLIRRN